MAEEKVYRRRWVRRLIWGALGLVIVAAIVIAWQPRPVAIDVATVSRGRFVVTVDEDGRTRVKDRYTVSAPLSGNLARPELHPGDTVKEGQVLARIAPLAPPLLDERTRASAEARVAAALAALQQAKAAIDRVRTAKEFADREVERQSALRQQGAVPPQALERAELEAKSRHEEQTSATFGARVAEHELQVARSALGRLRSGKAPETQDQFELTAPVSGIVLRVLQESGGVVVPGTPLLELGDASALEVVVGVLTADAVKIQPGSAASIERWGGDSALKAHVRIVEPSAFTRISALGVEEQRVNVVLDLLDPYERWKTLGDGYRVEVRIVLHDTDGVLQVPPSAAFKVGERWSVYRLEDSVVRVVPIEIGARSDRALEVRSGLTAGDRVVMYPSDRLGDGVTVEIR
ncbi:MAG: efflux RND transporter periplasmic adaptor subunit [Deltaproteobacteria bacterium]|nr:efflux RND transporter periplasmic adaptor subunit [Deltaproteobacteria bacterium]